MEWRGRQRKRKEGRRRERTGERRKGEKKIGERRKGGNRQGRRERWKERTKKAHGPWDLSKGPGAGLRPWSRLVRPWPWGVRSLLGSGEAFGSVAGLWALESS